jgi:hypothetical protein
MFAGHYTSKPRSRYAMDFQGQGQAITGETEALAIIDSFTKTVSLLALPNREASTLLPQLLDEKIFWHGAPAIFTRTPHSNSCLISWQLSRTPQAPHARLPAGITPKAMAKSKVGGDIGIAR